MKNITRVVVDIKPPRILTFEKRLIGRPKLFYDYFDKERVNYKCPKDTRLVVSRSGDEKINSAVGMSSGAFFLLTHYDLQRIGNNHLGFVDSKTSSFSKLDENIDLTNSFFINVLYSLPTLEEKPEPHLLLRHSYGDGYITLHKLASGETILNKNLLAWNSDLVWSDKERGYLILNQEKKDMIDNSFLRDSSKGLVDYLVNSPTYEELFEK